MKSLKRFIAAFLCVTSFLRAQTPFDNMDSRAQSKPMLALPEVVYRAYNTDTTSQIRYVQFDNQTYLLNYFNKSDSLLHSIPVRPTAQKWNSVDPLANKYPNYSPYAALANNPVYYIDPDGKKILNFDADGNYTGTTHDNWFHNLFVGNKGRILDANQNETHRFKFAHPKDDIKDIQSGIIKKIVIVTAQHIIKLVARSGGFDHDNKTENRGWTPDERYSYIKQEGLAGGTMDFSYKQIPKLFPEASSFPLTIPSTLIFLVGKTAHNQMNFGNFLFGAAGEAMGFTLPELKFGAHYNSLKNPDNNTYPSQFDSWDDQLSINEGFKYGRNNGFRKKEFRVGFPTSGTRTETTITQ